MKTTSTKNCLLAAATGILGITALTGAANAQALPTPFSFVSNLDLECFKTDPHNLGIQVQLRHLNPVLQQLPPHTVTIGNREQLCVPVTKNNNIPPSPALDFIRFVDLACYNIVGPVANKALALKHLNPVLQQMGLPIENVVMGQGQQLCVPVAKNNAVLPPSVRQVVQFVDLECFGITPVAAVNVPLTLGQLNPILQPLIPAANVRVTNNRQLCVPVGKNNQAIPANVLPLVSFLDLKKYDIVPTTSTNPVTLQLRHLNPLFSALPVETATLLGAQQLAVPVSKNGVLPPTTVPGGGAAAN